MGKLEEEHDPEGVVYKLMPVEVWRQAVTGLFRSCAVNMIIGDWNAQEFKQPGFERMASEGSCSLVTTSSARANRAVIGHRHIMDLGSHVGAVLDVQAPLEALTPGRWPTFYDRPTFGVGIALEHWRARLKFCCSRNIQFDKLSVAIHVGPKLLGTSLLRQ